MSLDKVPTEICEEIADFLCSPDTVALLQALLYSRRHEFYIPRLLKYFARRKPANGLFYSIYYNQKRLLRCFLQLEGINVNIKDLNGRTPLLISSQKGDLEAVNWLLSKPGIDVNAIDDAQQTPIDAAIIQQDACIVKAFLDTGKVDLRARDERNCTMLHLGIACGGHNIARQVVLVAQASDFILNDMFGRNPLQTLVDNKYSDLFAIFLSKDQASTIDLLENQILPYAVERSNDAIALQILRIPGFPARLHARGAEDLFLCASANGLESVVKKLLFCHSITQNAVDGNNLNALQLAAHHGQVKMIQLLLDFDVCPRGDEFILIAIARHGDFKTFQRLYSHESYKDVMLDKELLLYAAIQGRNQTLIETILKTITQPNYKQLLTVAAKYDMPDAVQLSIKHVFDFEAQSNLGTLLILAAQHDSYSVVRFLFSNYPVDPNFTDRAKRTALWYAVSGRCIPTVSFLLAQQDLDPNIADDTGYPPLRLAAVQRHPCRDILEMLAIDPRITPAYQNQGIEATRAIRKLRDYQLLRQLRRRGLIDVGFRTRDKKRNQRLRKQTRAHRQNKNRRTCS